LTIQEYFTPKSAYKGLLLWHSTGTGKTCSGISIATKSFEKEDYTIIWVTRSTLRGDIWKNIVQTDMLYYTSRTKKQTGPRGSS